MRYGAENQNKVANILEGNYENISALYRTALSNSKNVKNAVQFDPEASRYIVNEKEEYKP
jgi:transcriptional regulator